MLFAYLSKETKMIDLEMLSGSVLIINAEDVQSQADGFRAWLDDNGIKTASAQTLNLYTTQPEELERTCELACQTARHFIVVLSDALVGDGRLKLLIGRALRTSVETDFVKSTTVIMIGSAPYPDIFDLDQMPYYKLPVDDEVNRENIIQYFIKNR